MNSSSGALHLLTQWIEPRSVICPDVLLMPLSNSIVQKFPVFFHVVGSRPLFQFLSPILLGDKLKIISSFSNILDNSVMFDFFTKLGFCLQCIKPYIKLNGTFHQDCCPLTLIKFYMMLAFSLSFSPLLSHCLGSHMALLTSARPLSSPSIEVLYHSLLVGVYFEPITQNIILPLLNKEVYVRCIYSQFFKNVL